MLVVDDHRAFAEAVTLALELEPGFCALGIAATVEEALRRIESSPPDVVLVDITLPDGSGLDLTTQIKERFPATRVVVISRDESPTTPASAAEAGADDFRSKRESLTDLLSTLADPVWQTLESQRDLPAEDPATTTSGAGAPELTPREREVLNLLAQGRPPKHIARDLDISINTCRVHIRAILDKLGVHSQLAAVVQAARLGLFSQE